MVSSSSIIRITLVESLPATRRCGGGDNAWFHSVSRRTELCAWACMPGKPCQATGRVFMEPGSGWTVGGGRTMCGWVDEWLGGARHGGAKPQGPPASREGISGLGRRVGSDLVAVLAVFIWCLACMGPMSSTARTCRLTMNRCQSHALAG